MPFATALKVLIVDDKPAVRQVTRLALEKLGVRLIHEAGNGSVGLQKAVVQPLDLIISEFSMPKMDGLQLLRAIRGHPAVRKLPFILISGRGDREFLVTAAQAGVNTYLIKPFTDRILREKIEEVVGRLS